MRDLLVILDQLDEARAKATPGPWEVIETGGTDLFSGESYRSVEIDFADPDEGSGLMLGEHENASNDAALIVAAVNRLPQLTAALRAVLEVHQRFTDSYGVTRLWCQHDPDDTWPCPTVEAITAALTPEATS